MKIERMKPINMVADLCEKITETLQPDLFDASMNDKRRAIAAALQTWGLQRRLEKASADNFVDIDWLLGERDPKQDVPDERALERSFGGARISKRARSYFEVAKSVLDSELLFILLTLEELLYAQDHMKGRAETEDKETIQLLAFDLYEAEISACIGRVCTRILEKRITCVGPE